MLALSYDDYFISDSGTRDQVDGLFVSEVPAARISPEKDGRFYLISTNCPSTLDHVFDREIAQYRQNLLQRLCCERNVLILFSVVLPLRTLDVVVTLDYRYLPEIMQILDTNVSRYVRRNRPAMADHSVFSGSPTYMAIREIWTLMYLGKHLYDQVDALSLSNRTVPYSCFEDFEVNYMPRPYDARIVRTLFGMCVLDLLHLYSTRSRGEVYDFARNQFRDWDWEDNWKLFHA